MKRCFHKWKVASQVPQESSFDQMIAAGMQSLERFPMDIFKRDIIVTYFCVHCSAEKVERV